MIFYREMHFYSNKHKWEPLTVSCCSIGLRNYKNNSAMNFAVFSKHTPVYIESVSTKKIGDIIITELFENKENNLVVVH